MRRSWDQACDRALVVLRRDRDQARARGDDWVAKYLANAVGQVQLIRAMVDGRRIRPGLAASGFVRDAPPDLGAPPYEESGRALSELSRMWESGLGAAGWDWRAGFPPGWPTSLGDRVRAWLGVRSAE